MSVRYGEPPQTVRQIPIVECDVGDAAGPEQSAEALVRLRVDLRHVVPHPEVAVDGGGQARV